MKLSLAKDLVAVSKSLSGIEALETKEEFEPYRAALIQHSSQGAMLASQIDWTNRSEECLLKDTQVDIVAERISHILANLAEQVLGDIEKSVRKKYEQLITECVHQRDVSRILVKKAVTSVKDFSWQYYMRFYFNTHEADPLKQLSIKMGNALFGYSYEYLGVSEKLV